MARWKTYENGMNDLVSNVRYLRVLGMELKLYQY